jgi:glycine reductase
LDGGIVSGNCVSACDKNTTYHHQNNPIIAELYRKHGRELNFVGVVLSNEPARLTGKEASAAKAIEQIKNLKAQGVVLSKEGFGNPDADQMILTRGLEQAGIKVVAITDEYAGADGLSQSLADATPEAEAVISVGNANELIVLPPMDRLLGPLEDLSHLAGAYPQSLLEDGSLEIELQGIIGATNELGFQTLSSREV